MKMTHSIIVALATVVLFAVITPIGRADCPWTVLKDDFNDGVIDGERWWINTYSKGSSVTERYPEGYLESKNRGHLNSKFQWRPGTPAVATLSVTGRFRLPNEGEEAGDSVHICVRSNGRARGQPLEGLGVLCDLCEESVEVGVTRQPLGSYGRVMWIDLHLAPDQDITLAYKSFSVDSDWYWFKVEDNGHNIRVWCNAIGNFSGPPELETTNDHSFEKNYVTFYGRLYEYSMDHITYFDDITVTTTSTFGGIAISVDKFGLLAPYIGLTSTIMVGAVAIAVCVKRVRGRKEKQ